jgi:hypothetical protein
MNCREDITIILGYSKNGSYISNAVDSRLVMLAWQINAVGCANGFDR